MFGDRPLCELREVGKAYGATHALSGVSLTIQPGMVHAVLGENGAGKSTLMKIMAGAEQRDCGTVHLNGEPVNFRSVRDANRAGIATVFQETMLFGSLNAVENMCAGKYPTRGGLTSRAAMEVAVRPVLDELGLDVEDLPLPTRQMLEIAKALLVDARMLILDESNSALQQEDSERLFAVVDALRRRGVAVIYVSHRLEEVFRLADTVSVLRNGDLVHSGPAADLTIAATIDLMLGRQREVLERAISGRPNVGAPAVTLDGVTAKCLQDVTFTAAHGEVVGFAGLEGSGCIDVLRLLFGQLAKHGGRAQVLGASSVPRSTAAAVRRGVAFVPSDRAGEGIAARIAALNTPVGALSGGNQQKVVFAKWRAANPRLILLEDPARGVDVGAKAEIFSVVRGLARSGGAVLFVSSDFGEYSFVCDRVLVLREGRIVAELDGQDATEHALLAEIHGGRDHAPVADEARTP